MHLLTSSVVKKSTAASEKSANFAACHFSGKETSQKNLLEFANWYSTTAVENITFAPYSANQSVKALRCVFMPESKQSKDSCSFEKQFTTLVMLRNSCQAPVVCFIAFEPTGMDNHFIFCVLVNRQLLIVNPLGNHFQEKNYVSLIKAAKTCNFSIVVSCTVLQRDPDGLVSCGVFSAELMRHIATLSADVITKALTDTKAERCELKLENNQVLPYVIIDIANTPLLPASLHDLHTLKSGVDYQNKIVAIRHSHFALLEKGTNAAQSEQVLFNRLLMEPEFLDQLSTDSVHASLIRRFSAVDEKLPTSFPVNMPLSTTHSVTAGIRSKQNIPLREKLKLVTGIPTNTVLDVIVDYCAGRSDSILKEHTRFFTPLAERKQDKPIHVQEVEALQAESTKNYELAQQHSQTHWGYEYCLRAAFYSQVAFALMKQYDLIVYSAAIVEQLQNIEQAFPRLAFNALPSVSAAVSAPEAKQDIVQDLYLNGLDKNSHKIQLLAIRQFAREQLKIYQTPADSKTLTAAALQPPTMQGIYQVISQKIKELFITIISESVVQYKKLTGDSPPCDYAFIALGSLAREEITPYSDLEFGLLLEDKANKKINDENKIYFRNLCRLINFKLLALGETPANILNIPMPVVDGNAIANPILKGMCFDARVHGGHKNPLGKRNDTKPSEREETIFELIGTPNQLAYYQDEIHYNEKGKLKDEPFLASSLVQMSLIAGGKKGEFQLSSAYGQHLINEHREAVDYCLNDRVNQLWNSPVHLALYQTRTLELLLSDIERFRPKMGKMEEAGRSYSVKHDLLRIFDTICDHLALFFRLDERSSWDRIIVLAEAVNGRPALFSATAKLHLLQAIDSATKCRLAAYLSLDEQFENAILTNDNQVAFKGHISNKVFHLPTQTIFQIYYTLFPFWQAAKRFRDTRGSAKVFQDSMYKDFYDDSLFTQGQIKLLLEGQPQALNDFKQLIAQEEKSHDQKSVPTVNQSIAHAQLLQAAGKAACETKDLKQVPEGISYLENAIKIYEAYGNSYAAELNDCYLDLALALQAQQQTANAKGYVDKARKAVLNSYGKTHPYSAHCDLVQWYLDQPAKSIFTIRNHELTETWHLPPNNDQYFVGREKELAQLKERFKLMEASQRVVLSAVSGLGGVGKTSLARYYIHHPEQQYSMRIWFRADDRILLLSEYREFALQFKLIEEKASEDEVIFAVKRHLQKYPNWLAIYDNAVSYEGLEKFLPEKGGHLIITTRRQEWHDLAKPMPIDVFSELEANKYLKKYIFNDVNKRLDESEEKSLKALSYELGYLPLALAQAGAYIKKSKIFVADYLQLYSKAAGELLAKNVIPTDSGSKPVAIIWDISLKAIQEDEKKEKQAVVSLFILETMSYLDSTNIPRTSLEQLLQTAGYAENILSSKLLLNNAIRHLLNYSMIQIDDKQNMVSVHKLVQDVSRSNHDRQQAQLYTYIIAASIHKDYNNNRDDLNEYKRSLALMPHLMSIYQHCKHLRLQYCRFTLKVSLHPGECVIGILRDLANIHGAGLEQEQQAFAYIIEAIVIALRIYGRNHIEIAFLLDELASHFDSDVNGLMLQKKLHEKALEIGIKNRGENDYNVAVTYNQLAMVCFALHDYDNAIRYYKLSLCIKRKLKPNNKIIRSIINTMINLAGLYQSKEKYKDSINYFEQAEELAIKSKIVDLLSVVLFAKANFYYECKEIKTCEELLLNQVMPSFLKMYEGNHIRLVRVYELYAKCSALLNKCAEEIDYIKKIYHIIHEWHGGEHIQLAGILLAVADNYKEVNNYEKAKERFEGALKIFIKHYGEIHPKIAEIQIKLGQLYQQLKLAQEGIGFCEKSKAAFLGMLNGKYHEVAVKKLIENKLVTTEEAECLSKTIADKPESPWQRIKIPKKAGLQNEQKLTNIQILDTMEELLKQPIMQPTNAKLIDILLDVLQDESLPKLEEIVVIAVKPETHDYVTRLISCIGQNTIWQIQQPNNPCGPIVLPKSWLKQLSSIAIAELVEELDIDPQLLQIQDQQPAPQVMTKVNDSKPYPNASTAASASFFQSAGVSVDTKTQNNNTALVQTDEKQFNTILAESGSMTANPATQLSLNKN